MGGFLPFDASRRLTPLLFGPCLQARVHGSFEGGLVETGRRRQDHVFALKLLNDAIDSAQMAVLQLTQL